MGEVHDAEQTEDDRQADGDEHVEEAEHQAVGGLTDDDVQHGTSCKREGLTVRPG